MRPSPQDVSDEAPNARAAVAEGPRRPKLLERLREALRSRHYSHRTEQTYGLWVNDHRPPHFHAEYAEHEALFNFDTLEILEGELPRRPRAFVIEWASLHREELRANGERARQARPLQA